MPVNSSRIHSIYFFAHFILTGLGCIRNVVRFPQLPNLSHISLQVSITSNKLCLKSNSLVHRLPSITLSSLPMLLLSMSMLSLSLLSMSFLLSVSVVLASLPLLSNSSLLSVSTLPALLVYTFLLLSILLLFSISLPPSENISYIPSFLILLSDPCLSLLCLSRLDLVDRLR